MLGGLGRMPQVTPQPRPSRAVSILLRAPRNEFLTGSPRTSIGASRYPTIRRVAVTHGMQAIPEFRSRLMASWKMCHPDCTPAIGAALYNAIARPRPEGSRGAVRSTRTLRPWCDCILRVVTGAESLPDCNVCYFGGSVEHTMRSPANHGVHGQRLSEASIYWMAYRPMGLYHPLGTVRDSVLIRLHTGKLVQCYCAT
ncbi:hypothetical protein OH77DRAFT_62884 [Trametes cingulata]|nr:hypothetical protein OH77DRAFT_62884 [Trametes cingulata]